VTLTDGQVKALASELDPRRIHQREGGNGKKLSYLATHDAKRTANRIFGYDGWEYVVESLDHIGTETFKNRNGKEGIRVGYRATVTVTAAGARRGDTGYGDAIEYGGSIITPHELAAKEAVSDALKRCLSSWGDQFGLVLYGSDPAPDTSKRWKKPRGADETPIDQAQRRTMFGIAKNEYGLDVDAVRAILVDGTGEATTAIPQWQYDRLMLEIKNHRALEPTA